MASSGSEPRRIRRLLVALIAVGVALLAQYYLANKGPLEDAYLLYGLAVALLLFAFRREEAAPVSEGDSPWREAGGGPSVAAIPLTGPFAWVTRYRYFLASGVLAAALLLSLVALVRFGRPVYPAETWLLYLAGVAMAVLGIWLLDLPARATGLGETPTRPEARRWLEVGLLVLIVLVGAFLRIHRITEIPSGLFFDEAEYGLDARRVLAGERFPVYFEANYGRGALFIYTIAGFFRLLGDTVFTLRLVSVFIGILTVPAIYIFAKQLFGWKAGLVAAFLLAVSRWHINFSRIAFDAIQLPLLELLAFYFVIRGLRTGRKTDFLWAGLAIGAGLNTYVAYRLVPVIIVVYVLHRIVVQRGLRLPQWVGLAVMVAVATLVAAPFLQYYQQHPEVVNSRAQVASVFAKKTVVEGIRDTWENTQKHLLMFNLRGDPNGRHNLPGEPMLDFTTSALFVLGAGFTLYRVRQPVYLLFFAWFLIMLSAGILSLDFEAPQALRSIGAIPVVLVFVALVYEVLRREGLRVAGPWGERVVIAGAALALIYVGWTNYDTYFQRQAKNFAVWNEFSTAEALMAREMVALGPSYQFYVTSLYYEHPTVRFIAPQIRGYKRLESTDNLPIREAGDKNIAVFLDPQKRSMYMDARRYYPGVTFKEFQSPYGGPVSLYSFQLTKEDIQGIQGLVGRYYRGVAWEGTPAVERKDATINFNWQTISPLDPPFSVEWSGTLYAERFGQYLVGIRSPGKVQVWVDEYSLLEGSGQQEQALVLARGNHALRVRVAIEERGGVTELYWQVPGARRETIPQQSLYIPPVTTNGLLGYYYRNLNWSGEPALMQVDPSLSMYFHVTPLPRPYTVEWKGKLDVLKAGNYAFGLESIDDSWLFIDEKPVVEAHTPNRYEERRITLEPGLHDVRVRYVDKSGWSHINLYWTPPGGSREIIPPERLYPPQGAYVRIQAPQWVAEEKPKPAPAVEPVKKAPMGFNFVLEWGGFGTEEGQFQEPRDVAVDSQGNVYVVDSGNFRIQKFDSEGHFLTQWGERGEGDGQFMEPLAVAVDSEGRVLVLDSYTGWVQRFDAEGRFLDKLAGPGAAFFHPRDLAVDREGYIYVVDTGFARVVKFGPGGEKVGEFGGRGSGPGEMLGPVGLDFDAMGNLFLADVENQRVQRLDRDGRYQGEWGVPVEPASVDGPHLAVGKDDRIYITDPRGHRILVYDRDGRSVGGWGEEGDGPGQFRMPVSIVADGQGYIYVADTLNHRIQKFKEWQ